MNEAHAKAAMVYADGHAIIVGGTYRYDTDTVEYININNNIGWQFGENIPD